MHFIREWAQLGFDIITIMIIILMLIRIYTLTLAMMVILKRIGIEGIKKITTDEIYVAKRRKDI